MRSADVQIRSSNCPNVLQPRVQLRYSRNAITQKTAARGSPLAATGFELSTAVALCLKILLFKPLLLLNCRSRPQFHPTQPRREH
jgi:hypothetical protein